MYNQVNDYKELHKENFVKEQQKEADLWEKWQFEMQMTNIWEAFQFVLTKKDQLPQHDDSSFQLFHFGEEYKDKRLDKEDYL